MENKEQAALTSLAWLSNCLWAKNTEQSQNNWLGWALLISNCGLHLWFPGGHLYAQSGCYSLRLKRTKTTNSSFSFSDLSTAERKLNCEVDFFLRCWKCKGPNCSTESPLSALLLILACKTALFTSSSTTGEQPSGLMFLQWVGSVI